MDAARRDRLIALIREQGERVTTARRALVTALVQAKGHVTADDLAVLVQKAQPDVHLSTIYRSLDALERIGVVDHVHLGHGRAVYTSRAFRRTSSVMTSWWKWPLARFERASFRPATSPVFASRWTATP